MPAAYYIEPTIQTFENIPTYIIQGEYDLVCPSYQAEELTVLLKDVKHYRPISGHSTKEPETIKCLTKAAEDLAQRLSCQIAPQWMGGLLKNYTMGSPHKRYLQ